MTITEALNVSQSCETLLSIRRRAWGAEHNAVYVIDGAMWYRRFPNAHGWPWKPQLVDLLADDWIVGFVLAEVA